MHTANISDTAHSTIKQRHPWGENNSSLSIGFVLHEGASFSFLSPSKQYKNA